MDKKVKGFDIASLILSIISSLLLIPEIFLAINARGVLEAARASGEAGSVVGGVIGFIVTITAFGLFAVASMVTSLIPNIFSIISLVRINKGMSGIKWHFTLYLIVDSLVFITSIVMFIIVSRS